MISESNFFVFFIYFIFVFYIFNDKILKVEKTLANVNSDLKEKLRDLEDRNRRNNLRIDGFFFFFFFNSLF